jgi:hypothetical protein
MRNISATHNLKHYYSKIHCCITLPYKLRSTLLSLTLRYSYETLVYFPFLPMRATFSAHLIGANLANYALYEEN